MTRWKDTLPPLKAPASLISATTHLSYALRSPNYRPSRAFAAAHIRAVRKQIEAEHGITSERVPDWHTDTSDERILWGALEYVSLAAQMGSEYESATDYLRCAEAGLRTLWRRGQS